METFDFPERRRARELAQRIHAELGYEMTVEDAAEAILSLDKS